ncbi:unnamed protein product [Euphydryas editha]|uniref:Uncharacterized protein n=1 Tax=Euphydryas editha TaxID=104508 RepID=A0AAU9UBX1_EUPED|nr:unnamed protein product [Euphydryas editha]
MYSMYSKTGPVWGHQTRQDRSKMAPVTTYLGCGRVMPGRGGVSSTCSAVVQPAERAAQPLGRTITAGHCHTAVGTCHDNSLSVLCIQDY